MTRKRQLIINMKTQKGQTHFQKNTNKKQTIDNTIRNGNQNKTITNQTTKHDNRL